MLSQQLEKYIPRNDARIKGKWALKREMFERFSKAYLSLGVSELNC